MRISWIETDVLAASGLPTEPDDLQALYDQGIRAIITLTERPLIGRNNVTDAMFAQIGLEALHAPIDDHHAPDDPQFVVQVTQYIEQKRAENKPVLIHCAAGIGRTGTMLHAYYLEMGYSLEEAKAKILKMRPMSSYIMLHDRQQAFLEVYAERKAT